MTGYTSTTPTSTADASTQAPQNTGFNNGNRTASPPPVESGEAAAHASHAGYAATQPDAGAPTRRTFTRMLLMAGVFAVGISVGLTAAWWMQRSAPATATAAARKPAPVMAASVPRESPDGRRVAVRGISPSELPYDGAPPPLPEPAPHAAQPSAETTTVIEPPEPLTGLSSGDDRNTVEERDHSSRRDMPDMQTRTERVEPVRPPKPAAKASAQAKPVTVDDDEKLAPKRRSASRLAKDREIERIRKEADKELQRKLEIGRAAQEERARKLQADAARASRRQAMALREPREVRVRRVLAQCDRMRNIFRREHCKWRVCAGMWGKHGCPSYARANNPHHTY